MLVIQRTQVLLADALLYLSKVSTLNYNRVITPLFKSTLGKHTRHFIELYQCLFFQTKEGVVNYDARKRNLLIETNKESAIKAIKEIQLHLLNFDKDAPIFLETDLLPNRKIPSSFLRELLYNYDHCVHHLALIRVGLYFVQPDIDLPANFGMAVATINHQQSN